MNMFDIIKLVELSNKLPCSDIEIKLAKKSSPAATINNLIKCCFKDIELVEMSYEKLKTKDASLLKDIHEPLMKNDKPTTVFAPDTDSVDFNIVDGNSVNRRSCPTSSDIAASMMIFKVRRLQNNRDIDLICKLLNTFNIKNVPISMKSVETKIHRKFNLKEYFKCYYICSECGSSNTNYSKKCPSCDVSNLVEFYLYPVKQQIQQLLLVKGFYEKLKSEKKKNILSFSDTTYGQILKEISDDSFTMTINCDGVCTPNKTLQLWPFVLMLNEIAIPDRRYLENVLIAGIIPATKKPTHVVFETCLTLICDDLMKLESGQCFYVNDLDQRIVVNLFTIASCTDKPAEALMQNVVQYNSEYGCPKCFCTGKLYYGTRGTGAKEKSFTIRVYPFGNYVLRCQEISSKIIQDVYDINKSKGKTFDKPQVKKGSKPKEILVNHFGHLGFCPLTKLKYMNYGTSFLTDSLHTIYGGAFKRLLTLLFDRQYRNEQWSLFKKLDHIDELLCHIKIPSTTQRRTLFHFGIPVIVRCMGKKAHKVLLLSFLTAINLASSECITVETINLVKELLHYFVEQYQNVFGLRHMTSNIHSLLHVNESLKYIGPLWMYSTFNYEGIDKDLISTVHGTIQFAKQLIRQHVLFRDAIIAHRNFSYPLSLFTFNEQLLNRKASLFNYRNIADGCRMPKPVSSKLYDESENGIATIVQSYFNDPVIFFHSVKIGNLLLKTTTISYGKLFADNCVSFYFSGKQQKMGLIQAIVKSNDDNVRVLIEELIEKPTNSSKLKIKLNNKCIEIPNTFILYRSHIYHLKHPKWVIKKHGMIFRPGNCVVVLEYPNLKDNS
ncbi:unnamed protein product [Rotaria socialis]|uniref:Transposase domain-containing protein n=1 Tax=Rotaria socialis TaxID=392032 RepID=A0A817ZMI3_9BILA|nr:unnamed protein product [Rotaria socialis]